MIIAALGRLKVHLEVWRVGIPSMLSYGVVRLGLQYRPLHRERLEHFN